MNKFRKNFVTAFALGSILCGIQVFLRCYLPNLWDSNFAFHVNLVISVVIAFAFGWKRVPNASMAESFLVYWAYFVLCVIGLLQSHDLDVTLLRNGYKYVAYTIFAIILACCLTRRDKPFWYSRISLRLLIPFMFLVVSVPAQIDFGSMGSE